MRSFEVRLQPGRLLGATLDASMKARSTSPARVKLNLESSVFTFTDGNKAATTFIENRGKLLLHLLCGQVPAPYMPGDYQLHETI
jgi:hypothetical protein